MTIMEENILICEDSLEGIFTAIYEAYRQHMNHEQTRIQVGEDENFRLFANYLNINSQAEHAIKVMRTLRKNFGEEDYRAFCYALASEDSEKAQAVYQAIVWGLLAYQKGRKGQILDNLSNPYIRRVMELSRGTNNEVMHLNGFLRFQELEQGILYSEIGPKNNIITLITPHFADRLPMENFIIYDEKRKMASIHPKGEDWYLVSDFDKGIDEDVINYSEDEVKYQELFRYFCHKISIKERKNLDLQRNMLPIRFRKYMTEFSPK